MKARDSPLERLKEILGQLGIKFRFEAALVDKLEEQDQTIYALKEDVKRLTESMRAMRTQYSELLMIVKADRADARRADTKR